MTAETLSLEHIARSVERSTDWVRRQLKERGLEHSRFGRQIRFTPEQAEAFVRAFTVNPSPDPQKYDDLLKGQTARSRRTTRK